MDPLHHAGAPLGPFLELPVGDPSPCRIGEPPRVAPSPGSHAPSSGPGGRRPEACLPGRSGVVDSRCALPSYIPVSIETGLRRGSRGAPGDPEYV
jgi:hypothetical protein